MAEERKEIILGYALEKLLEGLPLLVFTGLGILAGYNIGGSNNELNPENACLKEINKDSLPDLVYQAKQDSLKSVYESELEKEVK